MENKPPIGWMNDSEEEQRLSETEAVGYSSGTPSLEEQNAESHKLPTPPNEKNFPATQIPSTNPTNGPSNWSNPPVFTGVWTPVQIMHPPCHQTPSTSHYCTTPVNTPSGTNCCPASHPQQCHHNPLSSRPEPHRCCNTHNVQSPYFQNPHLQSLQNLSYPLPPYQYAPMRPGNAWHPQSTREHHGIPESRSDVGLPDTVNAGNRHHHIRTEHFCPRETDVNNSSRHMCYFPLHVTSFVDNFGRLWTCQSESVEANGHGCSEDCKKVRELFVAPGQTRGTVADGSRPSCSEFHPHSASDHSRMGHCHSTACCHGHAENQQGVESRRGDENSKSDKPRGKTTPRESRDGGEPTSNARLTHVKSDTESSDCDNNNARHVARSALINANARTLRYTTETDSEDYNLGGRPGRRKSSWGSKNTEDSDSSSWFDSMETSHKRNDHARENVTRSTLSPTAEARPNRTVRSADLPTSVSPRKRSVKQVTFPDREQSAEIDIQHTAPDQATLPSGTNPWKKLKKARVLKSCRIGSNDATSKSSRKEDSNSPDSIKDPHIPDLRAIHEIHLDGYDHMGNSVRVDCNEPIAAQHQNYMRSTEGSNPNNERCHTASNLKTKPKPKPSHQRSLTANHINPADAEDWKNLKRALFVQANEIGGVAASSDGCGELDNNDRRPRPRDSDAADTTRTAVNGTGVADAQNETSTAPSNASRASHNNVKPPTVTDTLDAMINMGVGLNANNVSTYRHLVTHLRSANNVRDRTNNSATVNNRETTGNMCGIVNNAKVNDRKRSTSPRIFNNSTINNNLGARKKDTKKATNVSGSVSNSATINNRKTPNVIGAGISKNALINNRGTNSNIGARKKDTEKAANLSGSMNSPANVNNRKIVNLMSASVNKTATKNDRRTTNTMTGRTHNNESINNREATNNLAARLNNSTSMRNRETTRNLCATRINRGTNNLNEGINNNSSINMRENRDNSSTRISRSALMNRVERMVNDVVTGFFSNDLDEVRLNNSTINNSETTNNIHAITDNNAWTNNRESTNNRNQSPRTNNNTSITSRDLAARIVDNASVNIWDLDSSMEDSALMISEMAERMINDASISIRALAARINDNGPSSTSETANRSSARQPVYASELTGVRARRTSRCRPHLRDRVNMTGVANTRRTFNRGTNAIHRSNSNIAAALHYLRGTNNEYAPRPARLATAARVTANNQRADEDAAITAQHQAMLNRMYAPQGTRHSALEENVFRHVTQMELFHGNHMARLQRRNNAINEQEWRPNIRGLHRGVGGGGGGGELPPAQMSAMNIMQLPRAEEARQHWEQLEEIAYRRPRSYNTVQSPSRIRRDPRIAEELIRMQSSEFGMTGNEGEKSGEIRNKDGKVVPPGYQGKDLREECQRDDWNFLDDFQLNRNREEIDLSRENSRPAEFLSGSYLDDYNLDKRPRNEFQGNGSGTEEFQGEDFHWNECRGPAMEVIENPTEIQGNNEEEEFQGNSVEEEFQGNNVEKELQGNNAEEEFPGNNEEEEFPGNDVEDVFQGNDVGVEFSENDIEEEFHGDDAQEEFQEAEVCVDFSCIEPFENSIKNSSKDDSN